MSRAGFDSINGLMALIICSVVDTIISSLALLVISVIYNAFLTINPSMGAMWVNSFDMITAIFAMTDALGIIGFFAGVAGFIFLFMDDVRDLSRW